MKIQPIIAFAALALAAAGCHPGHSVVGKWTATINGSSQQVEFTADSKMSATQDIQGQASVRVVGTYSYADDTLSVKATDATVKATNPAIQALADRQLGASKSQILDAINKAGANNKLTWTSDDAFTIADSKGNTQTFTRLKS